MAVIPATSSRPLFRRPIPSFTAPRLCASSSLSYSSVRCPPLGSKVSTFVGNCRKDFELRSGGGGRRRISGTSRLVGFASPSAKYIREDYLVKKVSAKELGELVKGERNVPLVVDFYATWCGPCIIMAQQLETGDGSVGLPSRFRNLKKKHPRLWAWKVHSLSLLPCYVILSSKVSISRILMVCCYVPQLAVEYENNVMFLKVDTDDEHEFAQDMQVRGLPTLYFISPDPSKDAVRTEGLIPPEMIKNIIDNEL